MTPTQTEAGFLSAGQFAQVCGVNKQTLLYYEKLGLFAPCRRLENGCRYYSLDQIDTFHVILALRKIIPLAELKQYLEARETGHFLHLYDYSIKNLSAQIAYLEQRRAMMQKKVELVKEAKHVDRSIVYTQYCPAETLKLCPDIRHPRAGGQGTVPALGAIIQYRTEHDICLGRAIGGLMPAAWLESRQDPGYLAYYSEPAPGVPPGERFIKPEGNYLVCYHKGDYHTTYLSYPRVLEYARQQGFRLQDYVYEESLIDETVELDPDNYVTRISVPFTV